MSDEITRKMIDSVDRNKLYEHYARWPELARLGSKTTYRSSERPKEIIFSGLGGSATSGDLIAGWLSRYTNVQTTVCRSRLPGREIGGALVLCCSASGNTPEALESAKEALDRGASVITMASGGALMEFSEKNGVFCVKVPDVISPRLALPFLLLASLRIVQTAFRLNVLRVEVSMAVEALLAASETIGVSTPVEANPAKRIALRISNRIPVIYGSEATAGAAFRFKAQLNENAKLHAIQDSCPELLHNEVESWEYPEGKFVPVLLRHSSDNRREMDAVAAVLKRRGIEPIEANGHGEGYFGELLSLVYTLDYTSYYTAILLGRDPLSIAVVDELKGALKVK